VLGVLLIPFIEFPFFFGTLDASLNR
jgi:hypothetical protein